VNTTSTERRPGGLRHAAVCLAMLLAACAAAPHPAPPAPEPAADPSPPAAAEAAPAPAPDTTAGDAASPYRDLDAIPPGVIVHVPTGREMTFEQMIDVAADARVVYVGEMHNNLADHRIQLRVLKALQARHPDGLMVGMEMFATDAQPALDDWLAGRMDAAAFLTLWYGNWSEYYGYYKDILDFIREHHIPLVALNAPRARVRAVSRGEEALPKAWDTDDPYHRAYVGAIMGGHGHGGGSGFYNVQVLWEETMAQAAYEALTAPETKGRHLVMLVGGGHIQHGFGVPRRLFERLPTSYVTILPLVQEIPEARTDLRMDVDVPEVPLPVADFVWADRFADLEASRVKLGVRILPDTGGMRVAEVEPGSAAEAAGVRPDDLLVSLDGRPLDGMVAVQVALTLAAPGTTGTLGVERDGERLTLSVPYRTRGETEARAGAGGG
jgi:uncharacterized iron-regulated protein